MNDWVAVGETDQLKPGEMKQVMIGEDQLLLANVDGEFLATTDVCSHEYVLLHDGYLDEDEIECPQHGSIFSMRTGEVRNLPATQPIDTFEVKIEGNTIFINPQAKEQT